MEILGDEQHQCSCYKECQEFQKIVELKDSGLVIYCHRQRNQDIRQGEEIENAGNTPRDVFLIHNKRNVKIVSSELTAELEKENISCPRCRKRFEHIQELMQEVKSIFRKTVMGICDKCRKKALGSIKPFCTCDKVVKKFISVKDEYKKGTKYKQSQNAYSDLQINRGVKSPAPKHELEVQELFSHTHSKLDDADMSKINLKELYVQEAVAFTQHKEPVKTSSAHTLVETPIGLKELARPTLKDRKQGEILENKPSMDAKEALKRRHDLSLRQMITPEKHSGVSKRPAIYETPLINKEEKKAKLDVSSLQLFKDSQDKSRLQAEKEKKKQEKERQPELETRLQAEKEKKKQEKERQPELETRLQAEKEKKKQGKERQPELESRLQTEKEKKKQEKERQPELESRLQAEKEKKKQEKERQPELELAQKKKLVQEEKKQAVVKNQKKYEDEQRKLKEDQKILPELKNKSQKDLESKTVVVKEKKQDEPRRDKSREKDGEIISEYKAKDKISKASMVAKKHVMPKPDHVTDGLSEKNKGEQKDKGMAKDEVSRKELETIQKGKLTRKPQAAKDSEEEDSKGPSKKRVLPTDEVLVSAPKTQKTLKKETSKKNVPTITKEREEKELEDNKLKREIAEFQKLQMEHRLKERAEARNKDKKKQLEYEPKVAKDQADPKAILDEFEGMLRQNEPLDDNVKLDIIKQDSSIEVMGLDSKKKQEKTDIIIGERIFKYKSRLEKTKEPQNVPVLFQKQFCAKTHVAKPEWNQILLTKTEMEPGKGIIHYALSDRTFIDKGWTVLPTEKVVRKMNVYRMRPAHPEFDWFEHNKNKRLMTYDTGEKLAEFDDKGRGRWYYRNGRLALDYYDAEETNAQQRIVVYSSGEPDERCRRHPITILATFDYQGNGIVFDHAGKIRLKYNQTEGVLLDRGIGPVSHWQWHSLNDPPVLQQVMIDTQLAHKDPKVLKLGSTSDRKIRPDNEEMLAIEFDNFIKEKNKKLSQKFEPFQIRMKALKINEQFSLKVLDQASIYLIFRDGSTNLKLNLGMILDHQEIMDTNTAEVGEVSSNLERFPARTDSLEGLQRSVAHAQRYERQHVKRERWLRPSQPCASADQLIAAASPPMRLPFRTVPMGASSCTGYCRRKPTNNLYYDTRLRS